MCCLLKFQSWIGFSEGMVTTDHSSIVQWYKEDLCTISGPLGRRGWWHKVLRRFNIIIEYNPGLTHEEADTLPRWAYPAGAAQDTNFHGSNRSLAGWTAREQKECAERRQFLQHRYPEALGASNSMTHEGNVCHFSSQEEALRLLKVCCNACKGLKHISVPLDDDEIDLDTCILDGRSAHKYAHLSHPSEKHAQVHEGSINTVQEEFIPPLRAPFPSFEGSWA